MAAQATALATHPGGGLPGAVSAEWVKLWSVRSTWYGLVAAVLLMAATAAQVAINVVSNNTNEVATDDQGVVQAGTVALGSLQLVQFAVIAVAMLVVAGEYGTGSIRSSLQAVPSRARLVLAKAAVTGAVVLVVGVVLGLIGTLVAYPLLGEYGTLTVRDAATNAFVAGAYLGLVALFTTGVAWALRSGIATLVVVFMLLLVVPEVLGVSPIGWLADIADWLPGGAAQHVLGGGDDPYGRVGGLALLGGWALLVQAAGYAVLRRRDA